MGPSEGVLATCLRTAIAMTVEMQQKWVMGAMMNEKLEQEGRERGVHSSGVVEVLYLEWLEGEVVRGMQGEVGGNSRGRQK